MVRIKVLKILDLKLGDDHAKEQFEYSLGVFQDRLALKLNRYFTN